MRIDPVRVVDKVLDARDQAVGYVAWCLWLIAMAVVLWRSPQRSPSRSVVSRPAGAVSAAS